MAAPDEARCGQSTHEQLLSASELPRVHVDCLEPNPRHATTEALRRSDAFYQDISDRMRLVLAQHEISPLYLLKSLWSCNSW